MTLVERLRRQAWFWVPVIALWAIPALVLTLVLPRAGAAERGAVSSELPETVTVGERVRSYAQIVIATFNVAEERESLLNTTGTVTAIPLRPGRPVGEGADLIEIDAVLVKAHRGVLPFHREIGLGDSGRDVTELARYLSVVGIDDAIAEPGEKVGAKLAAAIKTYQRQIGAPVDGMFRASYVVYLPDSVTEFGEPLVEIGSQVASGMPFARPAISVTAANISSADGPLRVNHPGPYVLTMGEEHVPLSATVLDQKQAGDLKRALEGIGATPRIGIEEGTVAIDSLGFRIAQPIAVGAVPPSALYTAPSGTTCVFTVNSEAPNQSVTAVPTALATALEGEVAVAAVDANLVGQTVVRSALTLQDSVLAGCK